MCLFFVIFDGYLGTGSEPVWGKTCDFPVKKRFEQEKRRIFYTCKEFYSKGLENQDEMASVKTLSSI